MAMNNELTTNNRSSVVGVFDNREDAERAVELLRRAGFSDHQLGFATKDDQTPVGGRAIDRSDSGEAGEGAAKGAVGGSIVGGILGALATGLIPGIGPVIAGGILVGILGGVAVGAATGGIFGALVGSMGVPEHEARYYDDQFQAGRTIVTVQATGRYNEARDILARAGAHDFETRGDRATVATSNVNTSTTARSSHPAATSARISDGEDRIELHEERLQPRTETRETGAVELHRDVVAEDKTLDVPVTREDVFIERHAVESRPATGSFGEGATIEIPVRAERVSLDKEVVVYEEVDVGKRQVQETEQVSGTVRREEVHIEREGDVDVRGNLADAASDAASDAARVRSWDEVEPGYRQEWERRYGTSGMRWHDVEPYRRYSYEMTQDERYRGRDWSEVEPELRTSYGDWSRRRGYGYDESAWDRFKDQVRAAWEETRQPAPGRERR
jgi:uncharacterized protein (TIGR02271 family)